MLISFINIDPIITVEISSTTSTEIGQPLILQCNATIIMRGITSTVDIIWITDNTQVRRVNNITASIHTNSSSTYNDSLIIPSLNISDIGSVYQCEVLVDSVFPTRTKSNFTVLIPGTYIRTYACILYVCKST